MLKDIDYELAVSTMRKSRLPFFKLENTTTVKHQRIPHSLQVIIKLYIVRYQNVHKVRRNALGVCLYCLRFISS